MSRLDYHEIRQRAAGNWHGILTALGLPSESLTNKHQPCPACGGTDRYRFDDKGGNGGFICTHYKNGAGDGFDLLMHYFGYSFHEAALAVAGVLGMIDNAAPETHATAAPRVAPPQPPKTPPKDRLNKLAAIWEQAVPLSDGDPVSGYLQGRGLTMAEPYPEVLRYHAALPYWAECSDGWKEIGRFPAMVAAITEADGTLAGLHITYLKRCYTKPQGDSGGYTQSYTKLNLHHPETGAQLPAKKMQVRFEGMSWLSGHAVRLFQPVNNALMVCEGIETALAAHELTGWPVSACLSTSGLKSFKWPSELQALGIYADHDPAGLEAADKLARRAIQAGLGVFTWKSDTPNTDALDELNAIQAAEAAGGIND